MLAWVVIDRRHPLPPSKSRPIRALHLRHSSTFHPSNIPTSQRSPIRISHLPYPLPSSVSHNSFVCHSYANSASRTILRDENAGVCTNNSHSGTRPSFTLRFADRRFRLGRNGPLITLRSTQVLSFHILAHSFALFCTHTKLNPFLFKRFRTLCKKTPGVGVGGQIANER